MSDKELGLKVFKAFYSWNKSFHPTVFNYSLDQFLNFYGKKKDIYLDGIGGGVRESGISDSRIDTAMRSMAQQSKGKIPENPLVMFQYLSNESVKVNWVDAVAFTVVESGKTVVGGAESLGNSLITTAKIVNFILPAILLFFLYVWLNNKSGGELKRVLRRK